MFLESDANWKQLFEASAAGGNHAAANRPVRQWQSTTMLNLEKAVKEMQRSLSVKNRNSKTIYRFAVSLTEISYGVYKEITPQRMYHNLLL